MREKNAVIILFTILLITLLIPVGCSEKQSASQKPQSSNIGQKPKAPTAAKDIMEDITTIIAELNRKTQMQKVPTVEQAANAPQEGQGKQSQGESKGQDQSGDQKKNQGDQSQQNQQQQRISQWQKEMQSLKNLHRNWNMLEPQAAEAGLPASSRDNFEQALDNLTLSLSSQHLEASLMSAIELYGQYGELARVFTMPQPPEFYEVQYGVMAAMAEASREQWEAARERINAIEDPWAMLLPQAGKQDKMLAQRVDFSLRDLMDAINSEEINLVAVKGEIALNNLKALEKKLSQATTTQ